MWRIRLAALRALSGRLILEPREALILAEHFEHVENSGGCRAARQRHAQRLCELAELAFADEGNDLTGIRGHVADSGEGRWTIEDATAHDVPTPVITASLYSRLRSRGNGDFADRVLAALRNQFGGHAVKTRS